MNLAIISKISAELVEEIFENSPLKDVWKEFGFEYQVATEQKISTIIHKMVNDYLTTRDSINTSIDRLLSDGQDIMIISTDLTPLLTKGIEKIDVTTLEAREKLMYDELTKSLKTSMGLSKNGG